MATAASMEAFLKDSHHIALMREHFLAGSDESKKTHIAVVMKIQTNGTKEEMLEAAEEMCRSIMKSAEDNYWTKCQVGKNQDFTITDEIIALNPHILEQHLARKKCSEQAKDGIPSEMQE